jgi:serine/threonine-protein kinase
MGESPEAEEEARRFLQQRLALLYGVLCALNAFALVTSLPKLHADPAPSAALLRTAGAFSALVALQGGLWLLCWRGRWPAWVLNMLDVGGTAAVCVLSVVASALHPDLDNAFLNAVLSLTYTLLGRAVVVPSRGERTLALGGFAVALAGGAGVLVGTGASPTLPSILGAAWALVKPVGLSALLAALTSRVIYGLRREVRQARRLGQYVLEERIGQGGMGVVYRARHALLRRETAVKLLRPERLGPAALRRFEREVQLTARLAHPHTVAIFDYGRSPDGVFYYAMEYLDGGDLDDVVSLVGPLPPGRVVYILEQVCRALREAHAAGLIHRDLKPANILLCERAGEADVSKVVDFGLVKDLAADANASGARPSGLTGTPLYMAPEAITTPESVDARGDLYALGALGYFLLTGEPVFPATTAVEACAHHLHTVPVPPSVRTGQPVPPRLEAVLLRCLEKEPARRPPSAEALRELLLGCTDVPPWTDADAAAWWAEHGARLRAHRDARRRAAPGLELPGGRLTVAT